MRADVKVRNCSIHRSTSPQMSIEYASTICLANGSQHTAEVAISRRFIHSWFYWNSHHFTRMHGRSKPKISSFSPDAAHFLSPRLHYYSYFMPPHIRRRFRSYCYDEQVYRFCTYWPPYRRCCSPQNRLAHWVLATDSFQFRQPSNRHYDAHIRPPALVLDAIISCIFCMI